jgi:hypothetical protein
MHSDAVLPVPPNYCSFSGAQSSQLRRGKLVDICIEKDLGWHTQSHFTAKNQLSAVDVDDPDRVINLAHGWRVERPETVHGADLV